MALQILTRAMLLGCGIADTDTVLVALSGGADSSALLVSLCELRGEGAVADVCAAHLHHGIRGTSADGDMAYCKTLCETLGVRLVCERADVPGYAQANGLSTETAARTLRYAFLRRAMDATGASCILTAHHMGDQAETLLMHLLRGCGTAGLAGMQLRKGDIARPLLSVGRDDIEAYLTERGITWRTDETNAEAFSTRNRIRHTLLPLLQTFRQDAVRAIAETARRVSEDEAFLVGLANSAAEEIAIDGGYRREQLAKLPAPITKRIIKMLLLRSSDDVTETDIERVRALLSAQTGTRIELSGGRSAWVDSAAVHAGVYPEAKRYEIAFVQDRAIRLPCGILEAKIVPDWHRPASANEFFIDADALPADAVVRTRRDGDRFYPLGAPGTRKLSDVLADKKIPLASRDMPLLAAGDEVYCVFGLTISQHVAIKADTRHILHIVYKGDDEA